jgi:hypothetical protein
VAGKVLLIENAVATVEDKALMSTPHKIKDPKRRRRDGEVDRDTDDLMGSAASGMEDRREQ